MEEKERELYEATEAFWDRETEGVRATILSAAGFAMDSAIEKFPFHALSKKSKQLVVGIIGDSLVK